MPIIHPSQHSFPNEMTMNKTILQRTVSLSLAVFSTVTKTLHRDGPDSVVDWAFPRG
jgi:hypothetical protein